MNTVLVTGGAGYIGSHTIVALIERGLKPLIVDNFANSNPIVIDRIERICGERPEVVKADILDESALDTVFKKNDVDAVIHFAGLKAVGESVEEPLHYYQVNVQGTVTLLRVMQRHQCTQLVFSSSAAVYGAAETIPIVESCPRYPTNPYGRSKSMIEDILIDLNAANAAWSIAALRYFNPVAAHPSGLIGEDPSGIPNNLVPYIAQVAVGKLDVLSVFGKDYETRDGTGVRDYIHVCDLAEAHLSALDALDSKHGFKAYNVGTGRGYSVLETLAAFERACDKPIPYQFNPRRPGDVATVYADPSFTEKTLNWTADYEIDRMMADHWRWQSNNPRGYE